MLVDPSSINELKEVLEELSQAQLTFEFEQDLYPEDENDNEGVN